VLVKQQRTACQLGVLLMLLTADVSPSSGLVIYRFGGQDLPPPPEAGNPGVQYITRSWTDLTTHAGVQLLDVAVTPVAIGALRRDPEVNIATAAELRGGAFLRSGVNAQVWDGDTSTVWQAGAYLCSEYSAYSLTCTDDFGTTGTANIDLGGLFQVDRIRLLSGMRDPSRVVQSVRVFMAPRMPSLAAQFHPPPFAPHQVEIRDNRRQVLDIDIPPHEDVGFVQLSLGEHSEDWEVQDIQIFAKGFVRRATFVSDILDLGHPMAWGEVRWGGSKGDRARMLIQTRSGTDEEPLRYWSATGRGSDRQEVTAAQYDELKLGQRAGTSYDQDHWDFWSLYAFGDSLGTQVVSLSPRQFFQLRVDILPHENDDGELHFLEFRASEPVALLLVGEVWPQEVRVGESTDFTYVLRPTIGQEDTGFDRLEIRSQSLLGSVTQVRIGDLVVPFELEAVETHRLILRLPRLASKDSGALVEVDFDAQVLRYGTRFEGRVSDSSRPLEVPQNITDGDATGEYEGNTVAVTTAQSDEGRLLRLRVVPAVLTPNGDGVNDNVDVAFEVFEITGAAAVRAEIWDLAGRRIRVIHEGDDGIGTYSWLWDGRDEAGRLTPPGVYVVTVSLDADADHLVRSRILHVVY
jgi:hypothetical protein